MGKMKIVYTIIIITIFFLAEIYAGTTGKISGAITDAETGKPLPGANIIIEGTSQGAAADIDGLYYIINIPPGYITVNVTMIGYAPLIKTRVKIVTDMTSKVNFELSPTILEAAESVIVLAERPVVQKDLTSSFQAFGHEEISGAPIDHVSDLLMTQSGISLLEEDERASVIRDTPGDGLHIRGGRENETAFLVDGVRVDNPIFGGSEYTRSSGSTVTEMMTILGTFNAEYGGKMSGVVNLVTKEGTDTYKGQFNFYTDKFGIAAFDRNTFHGDLTLGGPLPIFKKISFFGNIQGRTTDGRFPGYVIPGWTDFKGLLPIEDENGDPLGEKVSADWQDQWSAFLKLTWRLTPKLKLMGSYITSHVQKVKYYHEYRYLPDNMPWSDTNTDGITFKMTYAFNQSTFAELSTSYQKIGYWMGVSKSRTEAMVYGSRAEDKLYGFKYAGAKTPFWADTSVTYQSTFNITSQINNVHMIKTGFDFRSLNLEHLLCDGWSDPVYDGDLLDEDGDPVLDDEGNIVKTTYINNKAHSSANPVELAAYIQDKMEFESIGMILNIGLRWEYWDIGKEYMDDPTNPINTPLLPVKPKIRISPRLGVSYPVSDVAAFHFAYGHFYQFPSYIDLLSGVNEDGPYPERLNLAEIGLAVHNPDINPEKSVTFEAGVQTLLTKNMSINVTAFYREMADLIGIMYIMDAKSPYRMFDNQEFGQSKGFEFTFNKRMSNRFSALINYTLSQTVISTSSPLSAAQMVGTPIALRTHLADWDRTHNIAAMMRINAPKKWVVSLKGKAKSGKPWTKYAEMENTERKPWNFNVDLKLSKNFNYFGLRETFYMQVYNVFDTENIYSIYQDTGKWNDDGNSSTPAVIDANPRRVSDGRRMRIGVRVSF